MFCQLYYCSKSCSKSSLCKLFMLTLYRNSFLRTDTYIMRITINKNQIRNKVKVKPSLLTQVWTSFCPATMKAHQVKYRIWRAECTGRDFWGNRNSALYMMINGVCFPTPTHTPSSLPSLSICCVLYLKDKSFNILHKTLNCDP